MGRKGIWVLLASGELSIAVLGLALPELAFGGTGCVAVVGRGAEGALFAAVLNETILDEDGDEEEDTRIC